VWLVPCGVRADEPPEEIRQLIANIRADQLAAIFRYESKAKGAKDKKIKDLYQRMIKDVQGGEIPDEKNLKLDNTTSIGDYGKHGRLEVVKIIDEASVIAYDPDADGLTRFLIQGVNTTKLADGKVFAIPLSYVVGRQDEGGKRFIFTVRPLSPAAIAKWIKH